MNVECIKWLVQGERYDRSWFRSFFDHLPSLFGGVVIPDDANMKMISFRLIYEKN